MARPTDYTSELAGVICGQIAEGRSLRAVCEADNMPDKSTVFRWLAKDQAFRDQYARAREAQADAMAEEILEIADDSSGDVTEDSQGNERANSEFVNRSRLRVDARKWLLSKMAPKKYGEKLAIGGAEGLPAIQQSITVTLVG